MNNSNNNNSNQRIISKTPSKEFLKTLNHLKPRWHSDVNRGGKRGSIGIYREFRSLVKLGKKEELSEDFVLDKLKLRMRESCRECGKKITVVYDYGFTRIENRYCKACKNIRDRREYEEKQENKKRTEDPIERYSNKILGCKSNYDIPYEEYLEDEKERRKSIDKTAKKITEAIELGRAIAEGKVKGPLLGPPEGMTKTQWLKQQRERRKQAKYEEKQAQKDMNLRFHGTPKWLIRERINKIPCDCDAQEMRIGKFCATCQLLVKVDSYMLGLFREEYERKSKSDHG